ncbi:phophatidylserine decarboxylase associated domain-containing protein [Streptomyces luteireticuli]|uniref:phophatidylserine decarboxylase associated domain-containing protein n=1 Tax=Streptomyces luteireticuli TaxID=173858 RepID=UPI003557EA60
MTAVLSTEELHARYRTTFGRAGGYLPRNPAAIDEWHRNLTQRAADAKEEFVGPVKDLAEILYSDGIVRMYVTQMINELPEKHRHVTSVDDLLQKLNVIVRTAPAYDPDPTKHIFLPMSALFGHLRLTRAGAVVFRNQRFGTALQAILQDWCRFLDSPESRYVLSTRENGWFSQSAAELNKLYEYECWDRRDEPHWGFGSFNDFFHRRIKLDEFRPLAGPDDPSVITAPNDGTVYNMQRDVPRSADFWIKGHYYSLENMLHGRECKDEYVGRFVGGDVYQGFLSVNSFHRWHVPVSGTIRHLEVVPGLMFSHAESESPDPATWTHSQAYQSNVNTRGLAFIETGEELGRRMVCAVVIGMDEVSSVQWKPGLAVGSEVRKGDELGFFSYGGSSMALVFEPGIVGDFTVPENNPDKHPDDGPSVFVRQQIARAV